MSKKMALEIVLVILGIVIVAVFAMRARSQWVAPEEAHQLVQEGATLLDVRTPGEYQGGHVDGAINIPVQELGSRMGELGDKGTPIVLYCQSGTRSGTAAGQLRAAGFEEVHDLGPKARW